jgi:site-specific DNA recombinase
MALDFNAPPFPFLEPKRNDAEERGGDTICLSIEAKWKRRDGALHLVVQPHATTPSQHPRAALIKAVVRGRVWCEKILDGQVVDLKSLARETDLTPNYVRHVLACAFLAPDIVEAILEGRQSTMLKFEHLLQAYSA